MTEANAPAYPVEVQNDGNGKMKGLQTSEVSGFATGLTKREYFAGMAMQGILANREIMRTIAKLEKVDRIEWVSKTACSAADALLLELSKPQP